jgi:hypothetical protein
MMPRNDPTNCQNEPGYPDHATVIMSIRYPELVCHSLRLRCVIQEPHRINECGEFDR